ncbi:hypothetical protein JTB14_003189 [Gonioctena quinquepunctata]|nr:hypothetical protein JTB14_003189 [Gonioctena quinquepunctata]
MAKSLNLKLNVFNAEMELVGTANLHQGVYKLNIKKGKELLAGLSVENGDIWHRRFGHINSKYLNEMKNNSLVDDLNFSGIFRTKRDNCEVCCEAKQSTFPTQRE